MPDSQSGWRLAWLRQNEMATPLNAALFQVGVC